VLGLSDAFIRAAETATANPIFLVDLQITATENHKIISAVSSSLDYPISVAEVSQVSGSLDIVSRKVKISECSVVVFDDDLVRSIFEESSREPKGRFVNVLIGFDDLDESDFAPYFRGILDELTPRPGHIELVLKNHSAIALDAKASGIGWYNKHPLQGISDILDVAGVPADAINVSELHPDAAQNEKYKNLVSSPGIEFSTAASDDPAAGKIGYRSTGPINASYQSVIESLAGMMHGACFTDEYGVVRFLPYDHDKAPIKHLTANDYRNFQQTGTYGNLCNHLKFIQKEGDGLENFVEFECEESQNAFMSPSGEKLKRTLVQNFSYCGVTDYTTTALLEPGGVANLGSESYDFDSRRTLEGISGLRITGSYPVTHWNTGGVSPDHPIYLLIDGSIIAVKEMQGTGSTSLNLAPGPDKKLVRNYSLGGVPQGMVYLPTTIRVTDTESGVLGTPEIEASDYFTGGVGIAQLSFIDVTAAVLWAEDYFKRFGHGCPTINIETSLDHYDLQIGDFITLDEAGEFYFDHKSGLSDSTVLEIVGKETHMTPSGAYISFKLAFVRRDGLPILTIAAGFGAGLEALSTEGQGIMAGQDIAMGAHVFDGLGVAASAGLSVEIEKGKALLGKFKGSNPDPVIYPLEAHKETYMYFDPASGGFMSHAVTIGAPEPTSLGVLLSKITTNGSGVDSVEDLREFASITGGKLLPGDGPLTNLDATGGFTGQIDIGQILNAPDFTGIGASVAGLDQRVGTIEGDYATSGDIPDVSGLATNTALSNVQTNLNGTISTVQTSLNGLISTNQTNINSNTNLTNNVSLVANEALAGSTHGLVSNPDFRLTNANGSPQTWNFWNSTFGSTFDYSDSSFYGQKSIHVNGTTHATSYPVPQSSRFPVYHGQRLKCRAIIKPTFAGSRMWGHVYFYRLAPDGTETYTGRAHVWHNADAASTDWQIIENSFAVPAADDSWWTTVSSPAPTDQPLIARIAWRQPYGWPGNSGYGYNSGDYDFRISYLNCFHVGFAEEDLDTDLQNRLDSIESTADNALQDQSDAIKNSHLDNYIVSATNLTSSCADRLVPSGHTGASVLASVTAAATAASNAQNTADAAVVDAGMANNAAALASVAATNAQNTADAAAASHYALAELELRPADVPSGGWNDEVIIVCPTMFAMAGGSGVFYTP